LPPKLKLIGTIAVENSAPGLNFHFILNVLGSELINVSACTFHFDDQRSENVNTSCEIKGLETSSAGGAEECVCQVDTIVTIKTYGG